MNDKEATAVRIRPLSDLHFEFHADKGKAFVQLLNTSGTNVLVLAGDLTTMGCGIGSALMKFRKHFGCQIVYVHGNHEFYSCDRATTVRTTKHAVGNLQGVHWLDCDIVEINGARILGTPLWFPRKRAPTFPGLISTDEEWANGVIRAVGEKGLVEETFSDFKYIEHYADWVYEENGRAIKFLYENLREGDVVVTHYLPSHQSVTERFRGDIGNGWFVSDVEELIEERQPAIWIHGHTHDSLDYYIGKTRVVCNPFGYVGHSTNPSFKEDFVVEAAK